MRHFFRYVTLVALSSFLGLSTLGGCAAIGEAIDCDQICEELRTCIDGDLNVERCSDRCQDRTDTSAMRKQLDACTDCLDEHWACAELGDHCPMCNGVIQALR